MERFSGGAYELRNGKSRVFLDFATDDIDGAKHWVSAL